MWILCLTACGVIVSTIIYTLYVCKKYYFDLVNTKYDENETSLHTEYDICEVVDNNIEDSVAAFLYDGKRKKEDFSHDGQAIRRQALNLNKKNLKIGPLRKRTNRRFSAYDLAVKRTIDSAIKESKSGIEALVIKTDMQKKAENKNGVNKKNNMFCDIGDEEMSNE